MPEESSSRGTRTTGGLSGIVIALITAAGVVFAGAGVLWLQQPSKDGPAAGSPSAPAAEALGSGSNLVLSYGYGMDLDSPSWTRAQGQSSDADVYSGSNTDRPVVTRGDVVPVTGSPDPSMCGDPTLPVQSGYIALSQIRPGATFCVRTTQDRWAWLTTTSYNEQSGELIFDVAVFP